MRRLMLLRHGKADRHSAGGDRERPLTRKGVVQARRMGDYLAEHGFKPDLAVSSNARRARQTLELALEAFPAHVAQAVENTIYLAHADHLLEILRQTPSRIATLLVVGHNPGFAELAVALAGAGDAARLAAMHHKYPPASLAVLDFPTDDWTEARQGGATLNSFVTPAELLGGDEDAD